MKYQYDFNIDFDKITNKDVVDAIAMLEGREVGEDDVDYVWWNPLGNYIYWCDGSGDAYYFCRKYLRIEGWNLVDKEDLQKTIVFLKTFSV